jgi:hypothetical protein
LKVIDKKPATGDKVAAQKMTPVEAAHKLFADTVRLLNYYHLMFAVPRCRHRLAVPSGDEWSIPDKTDFPVALYDRCGNLKVANTRAELRAFLEKHAASPNVLLLEVPLGSRFCWVEFEKGKAPNLIHPEKTGVHKLDQVELDRTMRVNNLFFGDGIDRFRLQFAVSTDNHFKLMGGVIAGY